MRKILKNNNYTDLKKFRILKCGGNERGGDADESILTVSTDSSYKNHDYHESSNHHQTFQRKSNVSILFVFVTRVFFKSDIKLILFCFFLSKVEMCLIFFY